MTVPTTTKYNVQVLHPCGKKICLPLHSCGDKWVEEVYLKLFRRIFYTIVIYRDSLSSNTYQTNTDPELTFWLLHTSKSHTDIRIPPQVPATSIQTQGTVTSLWDVGDRLHGRGHGGYPTHQHCFCPWLAGHQLCGCLQFPRGEEPLVQRPLKVSDRSTHVQLCTLVHHEWYWLNCDLLHRTSLATTHVVWGAMYVTNVPIG